MRVDWKHLDDDVLEATGNLEKKGFREPTVRAVYYVLGSLGKIPLTEQGYKSLDKKVVEMRKAGSIEWGFFAVKRGRSIKASRYVSPDDWAESATRHFREAESRYSLPRWYGQPNLAEVWVEKDGLLGAVSEWLEDLDVTVRAPQGYGAWEFIYSNVVEIRARFEDPGHRKLHVLYLGDLDPSGKDIPRFIDKDALSHFRLEQLEFREIALTPEQVRQYALPEVPDAPEVRAKIMRDPRYASYRSRYGDMFCELDAFFALQTVAARTLVRTAVEELFDPALEDARRRKERADRQRVRQVRDDNLRKMADEL